jgi:hypothetical protein
MAREACGKHGVSLSQVPLAVPAPTPPSPALRNRITTEANPMRDKIRSRGLLGPTAGNMTVEHWLKALLLETGPEAEARRAQALPLIGQDGTRMPDLFGLGPDVPIGETVRRRFFGKE